MTNKTICVDNALFLKLSKKLKKDNSLQATQEDLARAFGFRNLNAIQQFFNAQKNVSHVLHSSTHEDFITRFQKLSHAQALKLCISLFTKTDDAWYDKAITLLDIVLQYLFLIEKPFEAVNIQENLILDNLIKIYKTRRDLPIEFRLLLRNYLLMLPNFQESAPKQNDNVLEQHGYNLMPLTQMVRKLKLLEKNDVLLFSIQWMCWSEGLIIGHEAEDKRYIDIKSIKTYYEIMGSKSWMACFDSFNQYSKKDEGSLLTYRSAITAHEAFDDSWLKHPTFMNLVYSKFKHFSIDDIYLSDLLFDFANTVNPLKQEQTGQNISYFIQNIEQTKKISQIIQSIAV